MTESAQVVDAPEAGRFEVRVDDAVAGFTEYRRTGSTVALTHTVVEPAFEGRGLGSMLARGALDATRAAGDSVLPYCPFIRRYIRRHPEHVDLVPADRRAEFGLSSSAAEPVGEAADRPSAAPADTDRDSGQVPDKQIHRWKDDGGAVISDG